LQRFYQSDKASEPAFYQIFRPEQHGFKDFLKVVDAWRTQRGLSRYFYLLNFSPMVAGGTTKNIHDIANQKARYKGAFVTPGMGPPPPVWNVENPRISRQMIVNNYGRHKHNFDAKP
jgi:hypothetical protein